VGLALAAELVASRVDKEDVVSGGPFAAQVAAARRRSSAVEVIGSMVSSQLGRALLSGSTGSQDQQVVVGEEIAAHDELTAIIERAAHDGSEEARPNPVAED